MASLPFYDYVMNTHVTASASAIPSTNMFPLPPHLLDLFTHFFQFSAQMPLY